MDIRSKRNSAFTLTEAICVVAVLFLATYIFLPFFAKTKRHPPRIKCLNNLKNIGLAYRIWATDHSDHFPFAISTNMGGTLELDTDIVSQFQILSNELSTPKTLICPLARFSGTSAEATNWTTLHTTNITYYVGLNAVESNPASLLAGDTGFFLNGKPALAGLHRVSTSTELTYPKDFHTGGDGANLLFADGAVRAIKQTEWPVLLKSTGYQTNLFLTP